jgi:hypothetical protein
VGVLSFFAVMSLSDPLTLLREYTIAGKPIVLDGDHVAFGRSMRFPRKALTAYHSDRNKELFYAIDSVWSLLQGKSGAEYAKWVGSQGIEPVAFGDRRKLVAYLRGEGDGSGNIDISGVPVVKPIIISSEGAMDVVTVEETEAVAALATAPSMPTEEELKDLEEARANFLRLLEQAVGVPTTAAAGQKEGEDARAGTDGSAGTGAPVPEEDPNEEEGKAASKRKEEESKPSDGLKEAVALAKPFIRRDRPVTSAILKRERPMRSRSSILLAPTAKTLPVLEHVLEAFKKRNKMAIDNNKIPRSRGTTSTTGTIRSSSAKPAAAGAAASSSGSTIPPLPSHLVPKQPAARMEPSASSSRRTSGASKAIIVVPAAITAIVNMFNVKGLFEDNVYVAGAEIKAGGAVKETSITVTHTFDDGSSATFHVMDNPASRLSQQEWSNVVGVVAQGSTWQFKGWPFAKGETELFSKVVGYYIRFSDEIPNQLTKGWAVTNLHFSREKTRQHEVGVMMTSFWSAMHKFLLCNKPHLLQRQK